MNLEELDAMIHLLGGETSIAALRRQVAETRQTPPPALDGTALIERAVRAHDMTVSVEGRAEPTPIIRLTPRGAACDEVTAALSRLVGALVEFASLARLRPASWDVVVGWRYKHGRAGWCVAAEMHRDGDFEGMTEAVEVLGAVVEQLRADAGGRP